MQVNATIKRQKITDAMDVYLIMILFIDPHREKLCRGFLPGIQDLLCVSMPTLLTSSVPKRRNRIGFRRWEEK